MLRACLVIARILEEGERYSDAHYIQLLVTLHCCSMNKCVYQIFMNV